MNDRELLELAAKAMGRKIKTKFYKADGWCAWWHHVISKDIDEWCDWNPHTDNADAFELAVKLGLKVSPYVFFSEKCQLAASAVQSGGGRADDIRGVFPKYSESFIQHDPYAATRRAILLAAAEIGRGME